MTTDVGIANLALAHLGDAATVSSLDPPSGSVHSQKCATFYEIARDALLEMHDWDFAITRIDAALLDDVTPPDSWTYAYSLPNDCLSLLQVYHPEVGHDVGLEPAAISVYSTQPFVIEHDLENDVLVVFTNVEDAVFRYKQRVEDTTKFSSLFTTALSYLLASYLAGPIYKGKAGVQMAAAMRQMFASVLPQATSHDARQSYLPTYSKPAWLANR